VFGFGDKQTKGDLVFPLTKNGKYCEGFEEVLEVYNEITPKIELYGPTNFAPIINRTIEIVTSGKRREYHILVIITDGQVSNERLSETKNSIVKASNYPISIIVVGVGGERNLRF
jgi:E3 ubiquitin-protein ligase RGLG